MTKRENWRPPEPALLSPQEKAEYITNLYRRGGDWYDGYVSFGAILYLSGKPISALASSRGCHSIFGGFSLEKDEAGSNWVTDFRAVAPQIFSMSCNLQRLLTIILVK